MKLEMFFRALACAGAFFAGCPASGSTWTGAGDGVNWSDAANWDTAPKANSAVVFPADASGTTVIDDGFSVDQIGAVTLPSTWTGSVTQEKDITVKGTFDMQGGTWTVNGNKLTAIGHFYVKGGSFNAEGSDFIHEQGDHFLYHTGGSFHGGRFVYYNSQSHGVRFAGSKFDSVLFTAKSGDQGSKKITLGGTAEIAGDLRVEEFVFDNPSGYPTGLFLVHGDAVFAKHTRGGAIRMSFVGEGPHSIRFTEPAEPDRLLKGFACSLTNANTVTVTSDNGRGQLGMRNVNSYMVLTNGVFDASGMSELIFSLGGSENTTYSRIGGACDFRVPACMTFDGYGALAMNGIVFNDMRWTLTGNGLIMPGQTTNVISGNLYSHGAALWTLGSGGPRVDRSLKFRLMGDLYADNAAEPARGNYAGNGHLVFAGEGDQFIHSTNAVLQLCLIVDKTNGVVKCRTDGKGLHLRCNGTPGGGRDSPGIVVKRGTLDLTDTDVTFDSCYGTSAFWQEPGATLIVTNTGFYAKGYLSGGFRILGPIKSINIEQSNIDQNPPYPMSVTTIVTKAFVWNGGRIGTHASGYNPLYIDLKGDLTVTNVTLGGCVEFLFTGTGDQHVKCVGNSQPSNGDIIIDKPSGTLVLDCDFDTTRGYYWRTRARNMTLSHRRGRLDLNGHTLTVRGKYDIGAAATVASDGAGQVVASNDTAVAAGATIERVLPKAGGGTKAVVATAGTLSLPASGKVNLALTGKADRSAPASVDLFSYGTLKNFDSDAFLLAPHPDVRPRYKVGNRPEDYLVTLGFLYRTGLSIFLR